MNKIIAVDFDGVLCCSIYPLAYDQNFLNKIILWWIKRRQKKGDIIILWTCRTQKQEFGSHVSYLETQSLEFAKDFLYKKGFIPDYINENVPELTQKFGADSRKVSAHLYIDDKNIGVIGWILRITYHRSIQKQRRKK